MINSRSLLFFFHDLIHFYLFLPFLLFLFSSNLLSFMLPSLTL
jgi:hypothetical protein